MKKFLAILLVFSALLSGIACNSNAPVPSDTETESSQASSSESSENTTNKTEVQTEPPLIPADLKINGKDISDFSIVYPKENPWGEKEIAEKIANFINSNFSASIKAISDKESSKECKILVGFSDAVTDSVKSHAKVISQFHVNNENSMIVSYDNWLWLSASNMYTLSDCANRLIEEMTLDGSEKSLNLDYSKKANVIKINSKIPLEPLKIMSYNIQTGSPDLKRAKSMLENITSYMPDVIGMQEANYFWKRIFLRYKLLDTYEFVGLPRLAPEDTSNGNEYSCILFNKSKFNLIDSGTYWLSDTPKEISKLPESEYYRIMTYVILERKSDGTKFMHVNCHLSWDTDEHATCLEQTKIMINLSRKVMEKNGEMPVYFTGDFNTSENTPGYQNMIAHNYLDSRKIADKTTNKNTFSGGSIIDFCFVSKNDFLVKEYDVGYGKEGSDHYPVYVEMYVINKK